VKERKFRIKHSLKEFIVLLGEAQITADDVAVARSVSSYSQIGRQNRCFKTKMHSVRAILDSNDWADNKRILESDLCQQIEGLAG
jgi:hypothetical protein